MGSSTDLTTSSYKATTQQIFGYGRYIEGRLNKESLQNLPSSAASVFVSFFTFLLFL